jgi:hypothetical protein
MVEEAVNSMKKSIQVALFVCSSIFFGFLINEFLPTILTVHVIPNKFWYFLIMHLVYALVVSLLALGLLKEMSFKKAAGWMLIPMLLFPLILSCWLVFFMFSIEISTIQKIDAVFESFFINLIYWFTAIGIWWLLERKRQGAIPP